MTLRVGVFDYGAGNLHSLVKAIEASGASAHVHTDCRAALSSDALVLPGVGSFATASSALADGGDEVREALEEGLPCLGICLGMQILFEESDEGGGPGIGFLRGRVERLRGEIVPHMGWNDVATEDDPLFAGTPNLVAYYANSYVCRPRDESSVTAWSRYQGDRFAAAVRRGRCWGTQFHPEKSSRPGLRVIANFLAEAAR